MKGHEPDSVFPQSGSYIYRTASDPMAMRRVLENYYEPIKIYIQRSLRHWHAQVDEADDLANDFIIHTMDNNVVGRADRTKGRFRDWLKVCIWNFVASELKKRKPLAPLLDGDDGPIEKDAGDNLDRSIALDTYRQAYEKVKGVCEQTMPNQWTVFEERVARPILDGESPTPVEELMARLGIPTRERIDSMVQQVKRKIIKEFHQIVASREDRADVEEEVEYLLGLLGVIRRKSPAGA